MFERRGCRRRTGRTLRGYAAFGIAPIKIGFRAQDQRAGLPVEPSLAAADRTEHCSISGRERNAAEIKSTPVAPQTHADITANIKTAPTGDGAICRRWRIDPGRSRRQISRLRAERWEHKNPNGCCDQPAHGIPLLVSRSNGKTRNAETVNNALGAQS